MRNKIVLVAVAAAVLFVIAFRAPVSSDTEPTTVTRADGAAVLGSRSGVTSPPESQPGIDVEKLAPGEQPPQLVVVSVDGSCETRGGTIRKFMDVGNSVGAHFTFFITGLCLLPEGSRMLYRPPTHAAGQSDISFADADMVAERVQTFTDMYRSGHEIGTHFLGHFCGEDKGVGTWSTADWRSEIEQSARFLDEWAANNPQVQGVDPLPFDSSVIKGDRTPCLLGQRGQMWKAFEEADFAYEASDPGALQWPHKVHDGKLWQFPLPAVKLAGTGKWVLSMDYNFLYNQNNAQTNADPAKCASVEEQTYRTLMDSLTAVYEGNRAPLITGSHLNDWLCGAYINSLQRFITDAAGKYPDVKFVSFAELAQWLDAQDAAVLDALQSRPAQRY
ncbi:MAG: hypothetical protein U0904_01005 [Candidatus Nanopelagicales bacterium]|nr:hypothetical protein [Candidatus Nanopelagicales bacterium]